MAAPQRNESGAGSSRLSAKAHAGVHYHLVTRFDQYPGDIQHGTHMSGTGLAATTNLAKTILLAAHKLPLLHCFAHRPNVSARYTDLVDCMPTMLLRAHLALLLLFTLVLAPVTTALCGVHCIGFMSSRVSQKQSAHTYCVGPSNCCHSSRQAIGQASTAADDAAAVLKGARSSAGDHVVRIAVTPLSKGVSQQLAARRNLENPPGRDTALTRAPLRI
jgi:hypothetical protein